MTLSLLHRRSPLLGACTMLLFAACTLQMPTNEPAARPSTGTGASASVASVPGTAALEPADISVSASSSTQRVILEQRLLPDGLLSVGNPQAGVVMTLATNHACAYCQEFHQALMPLLMERYIRTGSVRLDILPLRLAAHQGSAADASMLLCAATQERGVIAHDLLMTTDRSPEGVRQRLGDAGTDLALFDACLHDPETTALYEAAQETAASLDLSRAPSYAINGTVYVGLPEYADVRGQVEEALQQ